MKDIVLNENERLDDLQIKGLKIIQNSEKYCFTSDAVLLSSYAKAKKGEIVCDFCSGSGIIAMLLYAKNPDIKKIYGIELQKELADMSQRSVDLNGLTEFIEILNIPVQKAYEKTGCNVADVVVCNPPYFKKNTSILSISKEIAIAKHEIEINIHEIIESAKKVLKFKGRFYLIHQAERTAEIIYEMTSQNIEPKVLRIVQARSDKAPHLVLIEGVYGGKSGIKLSKPLILIDQNNDYTEEAKKMYSII